MFSFTRFFNQPTVWDNHEEWDLQQKERSLLPYKYASFLVTILPSDAKNDLFQKFDQHAYQGKDEAVMLMAVQVQNLLQNTLCIFNLKREIKKILEDSGVASPIKVTMNDSLGYFLRSELVKKMLHDKSEDYFIFTLNYYQNGCGDEYMITLFGGKNENKDKSPFQTLQREVREEMGGFAEWNLQENKLQIIFNRNRLKNGRIVEKEFSMTCSDPVNSRDLEESERVVDVFYYII